MPIPHSCTEDMWGSQIIKKNADHQPAAMGQK